MPLLYLFFVSHAPVIGYNPNWIQTVMVFGYCIQKNCISRCSLWYFIRKGKEGKSVRDAKEEGGSGKTIRG